MLSFIRAEALSRQYQTKTWCERLERDYVGHGLGLCFKSMEDLESFMIKERKKGTCVAPIYLYPVRAIEEQTDIVWICNLAIS